MKIKAIHCIKDLGFIVLKLFLVVFLCYFILNIGQGFWNTLRTEYDNYTFVRGFENFGVEATANLVNGNYEYVVGENTYVYINESNKTDESVKVLYDILEPDVNILVESLAEIDGFYSDMMKEVALSYIKLVAVVFGFSLLWYVLDLFKYNKVIWGKFV